MPTGRAADAGGWMVVLRYRAWPAVGEGLPSSDEELSRRPRPARVKLEGAVGRGVPWEVTDTGKPPGSAADEACTDPAARVYLGAERDAALAPL